jgi:hypothetical protein
MRILMLILIVLAGVMPGVAFAADPAAKPAVTPVEQAWGLDKSAFTQGDRSKIKDFVDGLLREDAGPAGSGQTEQSSTSGAAAAQD